MSDPKQDAITALAATVGDQEAELRILRAENERLNKYLGPAHEDLQSTEIERLSTEGGMQEARHLAAQKCINQIDDLLEYTYKNMDLIDVREIILGRIGEYTSTVSGTRT